MKVKLDRHLYLLEHTLYKINNNVTNGVGNTEN